MAKASYDELDNTSELNKREKIVKILAEEVCHDYFRAHEHAEVIADKILDALHEQEAKQPETFMGYKIVELKDLIDFAKSRGHEPKQEANVNPNLCPKCNQSWDNHDSRKCEEAGVLNLKPKHLPGLPAELINGGIGCDVVARDAINKISEYLKARE